MFVDVFSSCKIILTTRKMNINVKIPPIVCFDVESMTIYEAVKLLTLKIVEVEILHANDVSRIEELAKDLHCWPLLLNLVHGQLYFHCIEWNESPQDAISKVQQKLFDNGLTAFDPEDQLEASRENAVRASITASLELLTKEEEIVLFSTASSFTGFGIYTFKDVLSNGLQMDPKQFDKYTRNLWCHGLITFQDVTFPNVNTKIPCIGIHEVIAHYINENMPDEYYLRVFEFAEIFNVYFEEYLRPRAATNIGQHFLSVTDAIRIPFLIRLFIITAKVHQTRYCNFLHELVDQNIQLSQDFHNSQLPSLKHMHRIIKDDCKTIHSLLADGEYNETITWAKQYFADNHLWRLTLKTIINNLNILRKNSFKLEVTSNIEDRIFSFNRSLHDCISMQTDAMHQIIGYKHVQYLVNAAVPDDDIKHYLKCLGL